MIHKHKETYEVVHEGISIYVRIDYKNNTIDLLDKDGDNFRLKKWVFGGRGVQYVNGWKNILRAMEVAMDDAKQRYEENLAKESEFKVDMIVQHVSQK